MDPARAIILGLVVAALASAQAAPTAADVTEAGRNLDRALHVVLGGNHEAAGGRTVFVLIDPTASVVAARFVEQFGRAITARGDTGIRVGVGRVGARDPIVLAPTTDVTAIQTALQTACADPRDEIRNVYADVQRIAATLAGEPGTHELLLVSLDNGDAEADLEGTVARLVRADVRCTVICSESYLADSYWPRQTGFQAPRGTELTGGDGPVVDLPWGWLFQVPTVNEITPSGFGPYGLTRLAAATKGRVFLFAAPSSAGHECAYLALCPFCAGDHLPHDETYLQPRVSDLAPPATTRDEALAAFGADPHYRAVVRAWDEASRAGLIQSGPTVKISGTSARPQRNRGGRPLPFFGSLQFDHHADRADRAAVECGQILAQLDADIARADGHPGTARARAMAELTAVLLQLAKVNLTTFSGWCREVAPSLVSNATEYPPPEIDPVTREERAVGIGISNLCLCHGVAPFFGVDLPGGAALRTELTELDRRAGAFLDRYAGTPYVVALHRSGIARFHLTYPGRVVNPPRPRPQSDSQESNPVTQRPQRAGGGSTGTGGPTTGGGR